MGLIGILLLAIFVISAIVLILVIMIQDEQGEGLGGIFGGGSSSAFGPRSGNVLTRFTSIVAGVFLLTSFGLAFMNRTPASGDLLEKVRAERMKTQENSDWWVQTQPAPQQGTGTLESGAQPEDGAQQGGAQSQAQPSAPAAQAAPALPQPAAPAQPAPPAPPVSPAP